jgi:hypothetical protein
LPRHSMRAAAGSDTATSDAAKTAHPSKHAFLVGFISASSLAATLCEVRRPQPSISFNNGRRASVQSAALQHVLVATALALG